MTASNCHHQMHGSLQLIRQMMTTAPQQKCKDSLLDLPHYKCCSSFSVHQNYSVATTPPPRNCCPSARWSLLSDHIPFLSASPITDCKRRMHPSAQAFAWHSAQQPYKKKKGQAKKGKRGVETTMTKRMEQIKRAMHERQGT